jgi:hypothetical protein
VLVYRDDPSEENAQELIVTGYTAPTYTAESIERKFKFSPEPEEDFSDDEEEEEEVDQHDGVGGDVSKVSDLSVQH